MLIRERADTIEREEREPALPPGSIYSAEGERLLGPWRQMRQRLLGPVVLVHYPKAEKIVLVMDNLAAHCPAVLYHTFAPAEARRLVEKLEIHHTSPYGSWLNMAESFRERVEILYDHHGQQVILLDTLMSLFAEPAPEVSILDKFERVLRAGFRIIGDKPVLPVDDLRA